MPKKKKKKHNPSYIYIQDSQQRPNQNRTDDVRGTVSQVLRHQPSRNLASPIRHHSIHSHSTQKYPITLFVRHSSSPCAETGAKKSLSGKQPGPDLAWTTHLQRGSGTPDPRMARTRTSSPVAVFFFDELFIPGSKVACGSGLIADRVGWIKIYEPLL